MVHECSPLTRQKTDDLGGPSLKLKQTSLSKGHSGKSRSFSSLLDLDSYIHINKSVGKTAAPKSTLGQENQAGTKGTQLVVEKKELRRDSAQFPLYDNSGSASGSISEESDDMLVSLLTFSLKATSLALRSEAQTSSS